MIINLEINESDTAMKKYLLIFCENHLRRSMSSFRSYNLSSSGNKQNQKNNCLDILIDDDVDQFDRSKEREENLFSSFIELMAYQFELIYRYHIVNERTKFCFSLFGSV